MDKLGKRKAKKKFEYFKGDFELNFGKYKGVKLEKLLVDDKSYVKWCYETIEDFKKEIDNSKFKNIVKINLSQKL